VLFRSYPCGGTNLPNSTVAATNFVATMSSRGWTSAYYNANDATPQTIQQDIAQADLLYFVGHGFTGLAKFTQDGCGGTPSAWGVGSISPLEPYSLPSRVNGKMSWMFFDTSDTVAAPQSVDPTHPDWIANWAPAFGGSLRGLYGYWQAPGSCPGDVQDPDRNCDVTDDLTEEARVATDTARYLTASPPKSPHDAWWAANLNAGRDGWSIWEDSNARVDVISDSSASNYAPTGFLEYYWADIPSGIKATASAIAPAASTFSVVPYDLINEPLDDPTALQRVQQYYGRSVDAFTDNGAVSTATLGGIQADHYYGTSGAVVILGNAQGWSTDVTTAYNAAVSYINSTAGMPSDAVLSSTVAHYLSAGGAQSTTAWEFKWRHAGGIYGGDAIRVVIDAVQHDKFTCTLWAYGDFHIRECIDGYDTYTYTPNVLYSYRLWRTKSSVRHLLSNGQPSSTAPTSIDAYTASLSLPAGQQNAITAYSSGYWTGDTQLTTSTLGAVPAWIYTIGDNALSGVDAVTGQYLGTQSI
jgi:hypothetical protein